MGTAFSLTFDAANSGDTPLAYSVSGNPAWLTLSTRTLSGTPTGTGTHTVTVTVTDNDGDTDTASFTLTVSAAADLMPSLPAIANQSATVGTEFSLTFNAATGGDTPLSYSVSGNPAWLTLSSFTLSGTPTATGTHTVTVTVTDNDNDTDSDSFTLTVSAAAVVLTLADFTVPTGNELVTSALIEAGAADFIYRDDDPTTVETSDSGEILDGDLEPATGYRMSLVRHPGANGFIFNDRPETDSISAFYGTGGDGDDLTIHVQDDTGVASFVPVDATVFASSDDFIRWDVPDDFETVLARIGTGDRLIIAFTRESAIAPLEVSASATLPGLTGTGAVELVDPVPVAPLEVSGSATLPGLTGTGAVTIVDPTSTILSVFDDTVINLTEGIVWLATTDPFTVTNNDVEHRQGITVVCSKSNRTN